MKKLLYYIALSVATVGITISCQEDAITENDSEALGPNSDLTDVLSYLSVNDTYTGMVIDSTNCFNIQLPVNVVANGQQITVSSEDDYATVENVFIQSNSYVNTLQLIFPLTIVYPDYSTQFVTSQSEYNALVQGCNEQVDTVVNCVAINYPISVFGYNSSFQVENTYELNSNQDLYMLLQNLGSNEYYAINYPVILIVSDVLLTVNSNEEMEQVVAGAFENCNGQEPVLCNNPGVLTDDLVLYMPFSNNVTDLMGSMVTAPTDTTFVADRNGNLKCALSFNGSQQLQITSSAENTIVSGDAVSISVWFKMQNTDESNFELLFSKGALYEDDFRLALFDLNKPLFATDNDNSVWASEADYLWNDTENWHHVVATLNANLEGSIYLDGVLQETAAFINSTIGTAPLDYFIGTGFIGYIDDLRVYRKVLTGAEVQTLFELEGDCTICLE